MSVGPPAGNGTTILTGRVGKASGRSCAAAVPTIKAAEIASAIARRVIRPSFSHTAFLWKFSSLSDARQSANAGLPFKMPCPCASLISTRLPKETTVLAPASSRQDRMAMYNANKVKIGLFGANCSSGRAGTLVPQRWSGSWPDNLNLARMADDAGIDFLLPIGRWKGYGGDSDYQGATLETITWATGLLASTKRVNGFGTVHAPPFYPIIAAQEMVTADHIGEGRFGLNIVVGWNEGEFAMFGVKQRDHEARYEYAQEWIDVIRMIWSDKEDFDFRVKYLGMKGIRGKPKPYGGALPVIMNARAPPGGQAFAIPKCDAFFLHASRTSTDETAHNVGTAKKQPKEHV